MGFEEYKKLEGNLKVGLVVALEEVNKKKDYRGLNSSQIKEKINKYDPSINDKDFMSALKDATDWGFIRVSDVEEKGKKYIRYYAFDGVNSDINGFKDILEQMGFIKRTEEILV